MNLGEFHTQISGNIRRGTSLDARIPAFTRQAARWIERNNTLSYMKRLAEIEIDPETADTPRYVELGGTNIKAILFFRWVEEGDDGTSLYHYLTPTNPKDQTELSQGLPAFYWMDGVSRIVLTATPVEVLTGELQVVRYTSWPTAPEATNWLIDNAEDVLEAATMMNVAKYTRDAELGATWKNIFDMGLPGLYAADQEFQWENSDLAMEYHGEGG